MVQKTVLNRGRDSRDLREKETVGTAINVNGRATYYYQKYVNGWYYNNNGFPEKKMRDSVAMNTLKCVMHSHKELTSIINSRRHAQALVGTEYPVLRHTLQLLLHLG